MKKWKFSDLVDPSRSTNFNLVPCLFLVGLLLACLVVLYNRQPEEKLPFYGLAKDSGSINSNQKEWDHVPVVSAFELPKGEYTITGVEGWPSGRHLYLLQYEVGIKDFPVQRLRVMYDSRLGPWNTGNVGGELVSNEHGLVLTPPALVKKG